MKSEFVGDAHPTLIVGGISKSRPRKSYWCRYRLLSINIHKHNLPDRVLVNFLSAARAICRVRLCIAYYVST